MRKFATWIRLGLAFLLLLPSGMVAYLRAAQAATTEVISPKGLRIWLIEDHRTPVFTLGFRFAGGSSQDPLGKEGLAHITAEMFFQGGGKLGAEDYVQSWNQLGAEINVETRLESMRGTVKVVRQDRERAMELLRLAVNEPRFDMASLEQVSSQVASELDREADDPEATAYRAYDSLAFGAHPRARPVAGSQVSITAIQATDIAAFRRTVMVRDGLNLSAVGDITPAELGPLADQIFSSLPAHGQRAQIAAPAVTTSARRDLPLTSEQAQVAFGLALPDLTARECLAAELINYTLGGSAFTSRLYHQVREKRGLAYSIGTTFDRYSFMSELSGSFGSAPGTVEEAIGLVRQEFAGLAEHPPSDAEIAEAKVALAGQYLRGLVRQTDTANELTLRMSEGAMPGFLEGYAQRFTEISPDEVRALARRIPWASRLVIATVGAPMVAADQGGGRSRLHTPPANGP